MTNEVPFTRSARARWLVGVACVLLAWLAAAPALAGAPSDAWITTKVKMKLLTASAVDGLDVNVDTVDGRVTLHGTVDSDPAKAEAEQRARATEGVKEVRNLLAVAPPGEAEAQKIRVDDEALKTQVETVLERDEALAESDVRVASVNDGTVLLEGKAESLSAHRRALEDARSVQGVTQVATQIESPDELGDRELWRDEGVGEGEGEAGMKGAASDTWITTKVKLALMADPGVSPFDVNVDTRGGVVTLFGIVPSDTVKTQSETRVKGVEGVQAVENELQVVPDVAAERVEEQDDALEERVNQRIEEREFSEADVNVEVKDGVARLTGDVASQSDRMAALTIARTTKGVRAVIDDLQLNAPEMKASDPQ